MSHARRPEGPTVGGAHPGMGSAEDRGLPTMASDGDDLDAQEPVDLSLGETGPN